jgi:C-type mannose receptor
VDLGPDPDLGVGMDLGVDFGVDLGVDLGIDMGMPDAGCGMPEECNAVDDDYDGAIDELPGGPRGENVCDNCTRAVSPGGVTYQICPGDVQWTTARDTCRAFGYELASPETMAEDEFLDSQLSDSSDWWIGLNDRDNEGDFEWSDGGRALSGFDDWDTSVGEPNDSVIGHEDCVRIETETYQWRTSDCQGIGQDDYPYVCEAP